MHILLLWTILRGWNDPKTGCCVAANTLVCSIAYHAIVEVPHKRCLTAMPETGHLTFTAVFSDRWYKRLLIRLSGTACRGTKHSGRTCDARSWGVMSQVIFGDIVGHFNVSSLLRSTDLKLIRRIISEIKDMTLAPGRSGDKPQNSTLEP